MNKREFVRAVMDKGRLPQSEARMIVDIVFGTVRDLLLDGEEVRINDVGSFKFKFRKPRTVRNNIAGTIHEVGPSVKLRFRSFRKFHKDLNDRFEGVLHEKTKG